MTFSYVISLLHAAIFAWALVAPFSSSATLRASYVIFAPFLMLHWILNDDTCVLTTLECALRGLDDCSASYVHMLISPLYKMHESDASTIAWAYTVASWAYAASFTSARDVFAFFTAS